MRTTSEEIGKGELANGLSLRWLRRSHLRTVSMGLFVRHGSCHEDKSSNGISHYIEHVLWNPLHMRELARTLLYRLVDAGARYEAFTSKEYTRLMVTCLPTEVDLALAVMGEVLQGREVREEAMEHERRVILHEHAMSFSSTRIIFNEVLDNSLWGDRSLGLFVIGRRENISRFDRMDLLSCLERAYTPERSCLVVIGPVEAEVLWAMAEWRLGGWTAGNGHPLCPSAPVEVDPRILSIPQKSSRVDLLFGFPVPSATAPERWTLEILSDILGAGFRSRLFLALREGRNLAYLVRAFPVVYSRSGYIGVQVNCAAGDAAEVCKVVGAELERLRREGTQAEEVERAKAGKRMVLLDTLDNNGSYLQLLGRRALQGEDFDPERELAYCQQVSGEEVHGVAHRCLRFDRAGVVARGPDIGELQKLVPADDAMERMAVPLGSGNDDHRE